MLACLITADALGAGHGHGGPGPPSGRHTKNGDNLDVCLDDGGGIDGGDVDGGGGIDGGDVDGGDGDGYDGGAPGLSAWASRERLRRGDDGEIRSQRCPGLAAAGKS